MKGIPTHTPQTFSPLIHQAVMKQIIEDYRGIERRSITQKLAVKCQKLYLARLAEYKAAGDKPCDGTMYHVLRQIVVAEVLHHYYYVILHIDQVVK